MGIDKIKIKYIIYGCAVKKTINNYKVDSNSTNYIYIYIEQENDIYKNDKFLLVNFFKMLILPFSLSSLMLSAILISMI